jgi:hypothetical protein
MGRVIDTQAQFYVGRSSGGQPGQALQVNGVQARCMEPVPPGQVILVKYGNEWRAYAPRNPAPVTRVVQNVRRRQVIESPPQFPLKILLERTTSDPELFAQGYFVGGTNPPRQITPRSADGFDTIYLWGITATGPRPNDWVAGGWARIDVEGEETTFHAVFYGAGGLLHTQEVGRAVPSTGLFSAASASYSGPSPDHPPELYTVEEVSTTPVSYRVFGLVPFVTNIKVFYTDDESELTRVLPGVGHDWQDANDLQLSDPGTFMYRPYGVVAMNSPVALFFHPSANEREVRVEYLVTAGREYHWATATGGYGSTVSEDLTLGQFVLPEVLSGTRFREFGGNNFRSSVVTNLDFSYAVLRGNTPQSGGISTNPWLVNAEGGFTLLDTDLNGNMGRCDFYGLTLYERDVDFMGFNVGGSDPWDANSATEAITVTPRTINPETGEVTSGTAFTVRYQTPPPDFFSQDASLWIP